jgi:hypothetical protein
MKKKIPQIELWIDVLELEQLRQVIESTKTEEFLSAIKKSYRLVS